MKYGKWSFAILIVGLAGAMALAAQAPKRAAGAAPQAPAHMGIGQPASADYIASQDIAVMPDGKGLPAGKGTAAAGATIYAAKCATCHGKAGEGGSAEALVGPEPNKYMPFGPDYDKNRGDAKDVPFTIGNYWPYATTVFDYTRRAMPFNAPGTLSNDEVYSLTAFLLAKNKIIAEDAVMDAKTLPAVNMPAKNRFVPDSRKGGAKVQ